MGEVDEVAEIYREFTKLLAGPTNDGQHKRAAGVKPIWKVDRGHQAALLRHLSRALHGEGPDAESGASPWAHVAWRACALAWQDTHADDRVGPNVLL